MKITDSLFTAQWFEEATRPPETKPRATPKKKTVDPTICFLFASQFWVFEKIVSHDQRTTLIVVSSAELKQFNRKKSKWKKAFDQPFSSHEEALSFVASVGSLLSLENPNKSPKRPGGPQETQRLKTLRSMQESISLEGFVSRKEYDLLYSMLHQFDASNQTLTPKQWDFIFDLFDRVSLRQQQRIKRTERIKR